jgi:hypothetical protein
VSRRYGAGPLHLLAHLAALALAGWALLQILPLRGADRVLLWLVGAIVLHDVLLWPLYSLLDRAERLALRGPRVNYVRVPAALSGLLLLVFFPVICGQGEGAYRGTSTLEYEGYLERWLLVSAALFIAAALFYVVQGRKARTEAHVPQDPGHRQSDLPVPGAPAGDR